MIRRKQLVHKILKVKNIIVKLISANRQMLSDTRQAKRKMLCVKSNVNRKNVR